MGEHNYKLKIADEFGFDGLDTFSKEDLARNDKEEKKIKAMRKEKKEKEEKLRAKRGKEGGYQGGLPRLNLNRHKLNSVSICEKDIFCEY